MQQLNIEIEQQSTKTTRDASKVIAGLARDQVSLDLRTLDLCFLTGLYIKAEQSMLASFEEDLLIDMFEQACDVVEPGADQPRLRATNAIQKLRSQHILARVDGTGLVRAGEYTLTRLAAAIVEYLLADEALTRESLTLLTGTLRAQLASIRGAAANARTDETWIKDITTPLRVIVGDLVSGIERRQRGLDSQQEDVQAEIARLLQTDWFDAIEQCQALMDTTARTLCELKDILLSETPHLNAQLLEIQAFAAQANNAESEAAAQRLTEHVDRITAWGEARHKAWSTYYDYVHHYIRDVVRLDPSRALSQRLREQIANWPVKPFSLVMAAPPSIYLLRQLESKIEHPAVTRGRTDREAHPDLAYTEDTNAEIDNVLTSALNDGVQTLAEITKHVLPEFPSDLHYVIIGRITETVAKITPIHRTHQRPWRPVSKAIEIEDWIIKLDSENTNQ